GKVQNEEFEETKIVVADYTTNTITHTNTTARNNFRGNIHVGGLVNINKSGDLHQDSSNYPRATKGIINSINYANISTYYDNSHFGITGSANLFAGGITTFNGG